MKLHRLLATASVTLSLFSIGGCGEKQAPLPTPEEAAKAPLPPPPTNNKQLEPPPPPK